MINKFILIILAIPLSLISQNRSTIVDERDCNEYSIVRINGTWWFAENLRFMTSASTYYDNIDSNYNKYGRLYNWFDAMKACPPNWHVPTGADWNSMLSYIANSNGFSIRGSDEDWAVIAKYLKVKDGWQNTNISHNKYGFSALPGGFRNITNSLNGVGEIGAWWSSHENNSTNAWGRTMYSIYNNVNRNLYNKKEMLSVRCVLDIEPIEDITLKINQ